MLTLITLRFVGTTRLAEATTQRKLRRAGYADGERRPRRLRHWANR